MKKKKKIDIPEPSFDEIDPRAVSDLPSQFLELHKWIYQSASEHHECAPFMSDDLNREIEKSLLEEYKSRYLIYRLKRDIETKIILDTLNQRSDIIVPSRRRHWWCFWQHDNHASEIADEALARNAPDYYGELLTYIDRTNDNILPADLDDPGELPEEVIPQGEEPENAPPAARKETWEDQ